MAEDEVKENCVLSLVETELCLPDGEAVFPEMKTPTDYRFGKTPINAEKKQHHALSLEMRIQVLKDSEAGFSHRQLAAKYKCGKTQIGTIVRQKAELLKEWATNAHKGRKRKRSEPYEEVNEMVWEWFQKAKMKNIPINGPILQAKAKEYAFLLEIPSFSASNGWLDSFRRRHNISFRKMSLKTEDSCDQEEVRDWKSRIASILNEYSPRDIYSFHETGILFRAIPNESLIDKGDMCKNGALADERLTVAFCCNAVGEKETLLVVSKNFSQWCLKGIDMINSGVKWYSNKKAWLTENIFREYLQSLNEKMQSQCRKIVLFLKDIPCHQNSTELSHIFIKYLPSCASGVIQPLDLGVVYSFKILYRKKLLKTLIARSSYSDNIGAVAKQINVLQAVKWAAFAWHEVKPELIAKCFKLSGIMNDFKSSVKGVNDTDIEFMSLCEAAGISSVEVNEDVQCFETTNGNWEVNTVKQALSLPDSVNSLEGGIASDSDEEDAIEEWIDTPLPLEESLRTVSQLRHILHKHCSEGNQFKVFEAIDVIEAELEDVIIKKKLSTKQKS